MTRRVLNPRSTIEPMVCALLLVFSYAPAASQCIDYESYIHQVASVDTPGYVNDVAVFDIYAYVVDNVGNVQALDIRDPGNPKRLGSVSIPDGNLALAVWGNYVCTVGGSSSNPGGGSLWMIDVGNPRYLRIVAHLDLPGFIHAVTFSGEYAYVVCGGRLTVIDFTYPENPKILSSVDGPGSARGIAVSGTYLYAVVEVEEYSSSIQAFDIACPWSPRFVGALGFSDDYPYDIVLSGAHAYIVDEEGIKVINVGNPQSPYFEGGTRVLGDNYGVAVDGAYAYVASDEGLYVIDIGEPRIPQIVSHVASRGATNAVAISGGYAYTAEGSGLGVIDITNPNNPRTCGSIGTPGRSVAVAGSLAYVADDGGLQIIDMNDPTRLRVVGGVPTPNRGHSIAIADSYACVVGPRRFDTELPGSLQIIDVSDPESPQLLGKIDMPDPPEDVAVSGNYALVADGRSGLQIVDIADPLDPRFVKELFTNDAAWGIAVAGTYAFLADRNSGLTVVDISDPEDPQIAGNADTPGAALSVVILGGYAYVVDYYSRVQVLDVRDPRNPHLVSSVDTPARGADISIVGSYGYLACTDGLMVIDMSDIQNPRLLSNVPLTYASSVENAQGFVCVTDEAGLHTIPTQCDPTPIVISSFSLASEASAVVVRWSVQGETGMDGFKVAALRGEQEWEVPLDSHHDSEFLAYDRSPELNGGGEILYRLLYRNEVGAWVVLAEQKISLNASDGAMQLVSLYPNPAKSRVVISYASGRGGHAHLTVHNVAGRKVADIFEGSLRPGTGQWIWSFEDGRGPKLAAGVYLVRLTTERGVQTRKVVLLE